MKAILAALAIGLASGLPGVGEENSAQRLENAQRGLGGSSWPKKPDNRLSSLSGKMKGVKEISPRYFGEEKEFRPRQLGEWQKEAVWDGKGNQEVPVASGWQEARWESKRSPVDAEHGSETYQPDVAPRAPDRILTRRNLERRAGPDWSSHSSVLGGQGNGALRMYEGRLTRVRQQVSVQKNEGEEGRDLGPGRREQFQPEEVEKMLSDPMGEIRGAAKERSAKASPLAAADN